MGLRWDRLVHAADHLFIERERRVKGRGGGGIIDTESAAWNNTGIL